MSWYVILNVVSFLIFLYSNIAAKEDILELAMETIKKSTITITPRGGKVRHMDKTSFY